MTGVSPGSAQSEVQHAARDRTPPRRPSDPRTRGRNMNQLANSPRIRLQKHSPAYWRVTFDHPPLNIFGPRTIPKLEAVIQYLEQNSEDKVVVCGSAVEGLLLTQSDFLPPLTKSTPPPPQTETTSI